MTPALRSNPTAPGRSAPEWVAATPILDHTHPEIQSLVTSLASGSKTLSARAFVQKAHAHLSSKLRAIYSIDDAQPSSKTLHENGGSCAQRMALLEALARAFRVPTRVRALWLKKQFWSYRVPLLMPFMPERTLMPWPQFSFDDQWVDFDEIYGSARELAAQTPRAFTNHGESLFDAIRHAPVDFLGKTPDSTCSIAHFVAGNEGLFDTRDEVMARFDRTTKLGRCVFNLF